jgi:hypothetical protein
LEQLKQIPETGERIYFPNKVFHSPEAEGENNSLGGT